MDSGTPEIVLSVRRPLMVQRSTSAEFPDPSPSNPGVTSDPPRRHEFYNEEIESHAHVTMETPRTFSDVISDVNWQTASYFAFLVTAAMFVGLGAELPTVWLLPAIATVSLVLFRVLKL